MQILHENVNVSFLKLRLNKDWIMLQDNDPKCMSRSIIRNRRNKKNQSKTLNLREYCA